jgi:hypothetical protein
MFTTTPPSLVAVISTVVSLSTPFTDVDIFTSFRASRSRVVKSPDNPSMPQTDSCTERQPTAIAAFCRPEKLCKQLKRLGKSA